MQLKNEEVLSYLRRLHINKIEPPSLSFLQTIHEAHVHYIPWQTFAIFTNRKTSIHCKDCIQLLLTNQSGYCFHLNHALFHLLQALGFHVTIHRAGVHTNKKEANLDGFHVGLIVHFDEIRYLVDVGLGDMPLHPILIKEGPIQQGFTNYNLTPSLVQANAIRLTNDPSASYLGVDYTLDEENDFRYFYDKHNIYSDSETSPWRNLLVVKNRTASKINELKGALFTTITSRGSQQIEVTSKQMLVDILHDVFHEKLCTYSEQEIDEIWLKLQREHAKWVNS